MPKLDLDIALQEYRVERVVKTFGHRTIEN